MKGCGRIFTEHIALLQHTSVAHPKPTPPQRARAQNSNQIKCSDCDRVFALRIEMLQHRSASHQNQARPSQPASRQTRSFARHPSVINSAFEANNSMLNDVGGAQHITNNYYGSGQYTWMISRNSVNSGLDFLSANPP